MKLDSPGLPCFVLPHVQKMGESLQKACILCLNVITITIHAVTMNQHPSETRTVLGRKYLNDIAYHESINNTIQWKTWYAVLTFFIFHFKNAHEDDLKAAQIRRKPDKGQINRVDKYQRSKNTSCYFDWLFSLQYFVVFHAWVLGTVCQLLLRIVLATGRHWMLAGSWKVGKFWNAFMKLMRKKMHWFKNASVLLREFSTSQSTASWQPRSNIKNAVKSSPQRSL